MLNHIIGYNPISVALNSFFERFSGIEKLLGKIREIVISRDFGVANRFFFVVGIFAITYKISSSVYSLFKNFSWLPAHIQA